MSRRRYPPGYYKMLNNKGKEEADRMFSGLFVNTDEFESEDIEMILVALDNRDLLGPSVTTVPKTFKEAAKRNDFET
jgi:hypothetical protein